MKENKNGKKATGSRNAQLEMYKLQLSLSIKDFQKENNITVESSRSKARCILQENGIDPENAECFVFARYSVYDPEIFLSTQKDKRFLLQHKILLDTNDKNCLFTWSNIGSAIWKYEEELFKEPPLELERLAFFFDNYGVPAVIRNALSFYIIYGDYAEYRPPTFAESNIGYGQSIGLSNEYIEIKVFGDTSKKEVFDNWKTVTRWQKRFTDYKNQRAHFNEKKHKTLSTDGPGELVYPSCGNQKRVDIAEFKKKEKIAKRMNNRRKKRFKLANRE